MIRIGIVGAENTHSAAIAKTLNVERAVPGFRVTAIWGETKQFARKAAQAGQIPAIVKRPAEMIGDIDAVVIDHRHAKYHLPAAEPFLAARLPMFIDKPFCCRLAEGKRFLARARRMKVPVTSFSTVATWTGCSAFRKSLAKAGPVHAVTSYGPCDLKSPYGGIFFYGIHQVDLLLTLAGADVQEVCVSRAGKGGAVANLFWKNGLAGAMHCIRDYAVGFQLSAAASGGNLSVKLQGDHKAHLTGIRSFCRMFITGVEPLSHKHILARIAVLEAMAKSVKSGRPVTVLKV